MVPRPTHYELGRYYCHIVDVLLSDIIRLSVVDSDSCQVGSYVVGIRRFLHIHICAMPPSTESLIPVTKLLSFDARKETAFAILSGLPNLPRGMAFK